jgi:hypothetical protein
MSDPECGPSQGIGGPPLRMRSIGAESGRAAKLRDEATENICIQIAPGKLSFSVTKRDSGAGNSGQLSFSVGNLPS